jgi:glycine/betaine/sarcosine/D-proline reductase family selenoprotein B
VIEVIHYLNQFYGRLGGEAAADTPLSCAEGAVGPGTRLAQLLAPDATLASTLICGDNFAAEREPEFRAAVREALLAAAPGVVIAGPAFNAGRYGLACGVVCEVAAELGIPAVTAMYLENPGVALHRRNAIILSTGTSAIEMERVLTRLAGVARRLARGEELGPPWQEEYVPHGFRRVALREQTAAERALDLLSARLRGDAFGTEIPLPEVARVEPALPLANLKTATIAVVTTSALVPHGNPDKLRQSYSTEWRKYSLDGLSRLQPGEWESIHGGFDTSSANLNPHVVLPLDALRLLEGRAYGQLHPAYYVTAGVGTAVSAAQRMGAEIAAELVAADVGGVVLTAT